MQQLLGIVVPLGLSAAVSPVMFSEQVVLAGGPHGRRSASLFAIGTVAVLAVVVVAATVLGGAVRLPTAPHLNATSDVALGAALLVLALIVLRRRPRDRAQTPAYRSGPLGPKAALGFGAVSMATNVTTLAMVLVAVKDVTATGLPLVPQRGTALLVLMLLASMAAWLPVLLTALPGRSAAVLEAVSDQVTRHGRQLVILVLLAVGCFLIARGALRLLAL